MRKNLNLRTSWYTPENWETLIEDGYLPVLAIPHPNIFSKTPIHLPQLAPRERYREHLEKNISPWKIVRTLDTLSHVACAPKGVVILTDKENDPSRDILREHLQRCLTTEITEYEYHRD